MRISVFCFGKMDFRTVFRFSAKRKDGGFSVILAGTRCVVNVGHFFGGKITGTYISNWALARKGQKSGMSLENQLSTV